MSVRERADYANNGVAMPIPEICAQTHRIGEWKNVTEDIFMQKFGNDTLKLYNLPTQAEMDQVEEYEDEQEQEQDL